MTKGQFYKWNPATEPTCKTLWQKAYVCIGVSGQPILPYILFLLQSINPHRLPLLFLHKTHLNHLQNISTINNNSNIHNRSGWRFSVGLS